MPGTSPGMTTITPSPRDILQPAVARLDAPGPHHHDLDDHKADHQPDHARQLVGRHQAPTMKGETTVAPRPSVLQMPLARSLISVGNSSGV